ncbi:hypothetical protein J1N35_036361 [Gossypium stocksii]|uniref:RNase H type-1 domain-containing protein n=1 Tax=Gossypium stocksii TaxID=47602 RepID=A0A9D3UI63_9ROSI|nr:hypothetical protein J1N35_036361 [Gossypium stocksii]
MQLVPTGKQFSFFAGSLHEWLELNLRNNHEVNHGDGINWACLFGIIIWRIWKNWNLRIFQDLTWNSDEVINTSLCWAKQFGSVSASGGIRKPRSSPGPLTKDGLVFLNTDGSVRSDEKYAAAGGLLCDHEGNLIVGFSRYLGSCEVIDAELWGILDGLQIALDRGFHKVCIRTDNLEAVNLIQEELHGGSYSALILRVSLLPKSLNYWYLQYIPREENRVADRNVKLRRDRDTGLQLIEKDHETSVLLV